mmetsp:Transcript_18226/g.42435  ORF Transcript_18226/g.42435 Transcript_18226/m.42435 type:complete len:654 (+) Transcript_18226:57-2018(+)
MRSPRASRRGGACIVAAACAGVLLSDWHDGRYKSGELVTFAVPSAYDVDGRRGLAGYPGAFNALARHERTLRPHTAREAAAANVERPPSQVEDVVANAGSLLWGATGATGTRRKTAWRNILAGFATSLAMIPESVSFAFVAGVTPICGLWSAAAVGFFAAAFGGRAGIASGAAGSTAVVIAALCASHGQAYMSAAVLLAGFIQIGVGMLGWGKFIKLVPHPVLLGFVNGLAVVVFKAQLHHFKDAATGLWLVGSRGYAMWGLTALSMLLVKLIPRFTTAVPASLLAIGIVTAVVQVFGLPAQTLTDIAGASTFTGGLQTLPFFGIPSIPWLAAPLSTLRILLPYALTMAAVGLVESLLTLQLVDGMLPDGKRGDTSQECMGQGIGNIASGLTAGMGGCAMIGQTQVNVQSGANTRLAGMAMAVFLGLGIVVAAPLLGKVPIAAMVGIMLIVCESTFEWSSLRILRKIPRFDAAVIAIVSFTTVVEDLAVAVVVGTVLSALRFSWKQSTNISTKVSTDEKGWRTYSVRGTLFFGSTATFDSIFNIQDDPQDIVIDFADMRVSDHSALEAINTLAQRYSEAGKQLHLRHLSSDCYGLLKTLNGDATPYALLEPDPESDPVYEVWESTKYYKGVKPPRPVGEASAQTDDAESKDEK